MGNIIAQDDGELTVDQELYNSEYDAKTAFNSSGIVSLHSTQPITITI